MGYLHDCTSISLYGFVIESFTYTKTVDCNVFIRRRCAVKFDKAVLALFCICLTSYGLVWSEELQKVKMGDVRPYDAETPHPYL